MQVRAKLAFLALAHHRSYDLVTDDEAPDVGPTRLLDELLDHEISLQAPERLDHALRRLARLGEHHADALRALEELDNDRRSTDELEEVIGVSRSTREPGHGQADALARQQLKRPQLVAGA